jgi:serine/threonine protein kinase/tetratricopeptide (TPR) repeat protein
MDATGISDSARMQEEVDACADCGSTSRVGRGLCLNCLLHRGLGSDTENSETLESVLDEIDVRDADWRIGNYQILEEIGRGGMGVIYRARQRHSRRIVALKRILSFHADSRETLARFRREAEAAASLDHPNILPIYEVSEGEDGLPFFSMKFAPGGSLVDAGRALRDEPRRSVVLMAKVARAVQYAHAQGILHRDLKPGNIMLDGRGEPLVSDFGLAKWLDTTSDVTRTLTIFGTPGYIAPEQARGPAAKLTSAADVYSLGAILFDLFTGRPPFLGEHALAVIQQAAEKAAPKLRSLAPALDRDLETICARCLEREPQARYHSAGDLAEDLECWLQGRPILARPVLPSTRIWRWSRRNPALVGTATACLLLGGAAIWLFRGAAPTRQIAAPEKSIAVLPFENLSIDQENGFFAVGVQDEILSDLAKVADLKVISRTSVMQYNNATRRNLREIARELGVAHVLEGSVQRVGNRIRVTAQLIDARTDAHLWAERYDRDVADIFAIQSEIANTITDQLQVQISSREKAAMSQIATADIVADRLYVQARELQISAAGDFNGKEKLLKAVRLLNEAVARDPRFTLAYCLLTQVHLDIFWAGFDHTLPHRELANAALQTASRLHPEAGEVHLARGVYAYHGFRDYDRARAELDLARSSLPNEPDIFYYTALIDRRQGRWTEAIRNFDRAIELDPRNLNLLEDAALKGLRSYSESNRLLKRALEISPRDYYVRATLAQNAFFERGDIRPLRSELSAILAEEPEAAGKIPQWLFFCALAERDPTATAAALAVMPSEGTIDIGDSYPREWYAGLAARTFGDASTARTAFGAARAIEEKIIRDQPNSVAAWSLLGLIDAGLGRKDDAIREGRRACEMQPLSQDPWGYNWFIINLAMIYAWTGEKDLALEQLDIAARIQNGVTHGDLKVNPQWDSLRGDPRFERIVASLAPKSAER